MEGLVAKVKDTVEMANLGSVYGTAGTHQPHLPNQENTISTLYHAQDHAGKGLSH